MLSINYIRGIILYSQKNSQLLGYYHIIHLLSLILVDSTSASSQCGVRCEFIHRKSQRSLSLIHYPFVRITVHGDIKAKRKTMKNH